MKKFFGFGSSTPPPPLTPPSRPPAPPARPPDFKAPVPAAAVAPAASPSPEFSVVGRWKEPTGNDTTEFHADGSVTERPATGETIRGRYSLQGETLKINLDGVPDEIVFKAKITAEALELSDPEGQVTRYRKA